MLGVLKFGTLGPHPPRSPYKGRGLTGHGPAWVPRRILRCDSSGSGGYVGGSRKTKESHRPLAPPVRASLPCFVSLERSGNMTSRLSRNGWFLNARLRRKFGAKALCCPGTPGLKYQTSTSARYGSHLTANETPCLQGWRKTSRLEEPHFEGWRKTSQWEEACQNGKWSLQNIRKRQNAGGCERPTCFSLQFKRRTVVSRGTYLEVTGWTSVSRGCTRKRVSVDLSSHQLVPEYIS